MEQLQLSKVAGPENNRFKGEFTNIRLALLSVKAVHFRRPLINLVVLELVIPYLKKEGPS